MAKPAMSRDVVLAKINKVVKASSIEMVDKDGKQYIPTMVFKGKYDPEDPFATKQVDTWNAQLKKVGMKGVSFVLKGFGAAKSGKPPLCWATFEVLGVGGRV